MVVLNRIYTRTGDAGTTGLGNGERRPKYDRRVEAYGTVDETNATIGLARLHTAGEHPDLDAMLARIQNDLFDLGADLCTPDTGAKLDYEPLRVIDAQVERLEREIDELNASLTPLRSFVLPGGSPASAASAPRPHGQPPRRAADGRARRDSPARSWAARRCATSTGCPTSSSSPRAPPTTMARRTCSGCPARIAELLSLSCYRWAVMAGLSWLGADRRGLDGCVASFCAVRLSLTTLRGDDYGPPASNAGVSGRAWNRPAGFQRSDDEGACPGQAGGRLQRQDPRQGRRLGRRARPTSRCR